MAFGKERISSYVDRGNELIAKGKTKQAMNLVSHGLQYYSEKVIDSISPYAKNDAGLIVLVLHHSWRMKSRRTIQEQRNWRLVWRSA